MLRFDLCVVREINEAVDALNTTATALGGVEAEGPCQLRRLQDAAAPEFSHSVFANRLTDADVHWLPLSPYEGYSP